MYVFLFVCFSRCVFLYTHTRTHAHTHIYIYIYMYELLKMSFQRPPESHLASRPQNC